MFAKRNYPVSKLGRSSKIEFRVQRELYNVCFRAENGDTGRGDYYAVGGVDLLWSRRTMSRDNDDARTSIPTLRPAVIDDNKTVQTFKHLKLI
jgi:hypothetical protein